MTHVQKLRIQPILKWISGNILEKNYSLTKSNLYAISSSCQIAYSPRLYRTKKALKTDNDENFEEEMSQLPRALRQQAQAALLEYLHSTRSLHFMDADTMSKNSPYFLEKLLKRVDNESDIGRSMARFLRYHPINEFEPFFESMGLKPSEYFVFLPRNLMFLNDDPVLLENYHVFCNYGIPRNKIGKIYKEATEVFRYDSGVLLSKLQSFEEVGLKRSTVIKVVASSPHLLVGHTDKEFLNVVEKLKSTGIEFDWIEGHLKERNSYCWSRMLKLLCLLSKMGCGKEELGKFVIQHPDLLFEGSGHKAFLLTGFMLKFGATPNEICALFLQSPNIPAERFMWNLWHCYQFLIEIEMDVQDISWIVRSHSDVLCSCKLKKANSLLSNLNTGKKRLCKIIKDNPHILKDWVMGSRVKRLSYEEEEQRSQMMKTQFLLGLGFVKDSAEMKKAIKLFRGRGLELQERFDCLVNAGLDPKDVCRMVKVSPQILNQSKEVIQMKIDYLVNVLGYPVSTLVGFPSYINYTIKRVKLRLSMYNWLKSRAQVDPNLALSTLLSCSDKLFTKVYVNNHLGGPEYWEKLKKKICSA